MTQIKNEVPTVWTTGWTDVFNTGTWRSAIPVHQDRPSPCHSACPVGGEISVWVQQLRDKKFYEAWLTLVKNNPFPAVTGRICHHPCEQSCNRGEHDGSVGINCLERFIGDLALEKGWELPVPKTRKTQRIAIVGGGPAGLSAAYQLKLRGFEVTVFEAQPELGGLLRYGIPAYRLPLDIVQREIQRVLRVGIQACTGVVVDSQEEFRRLQNEYDAIFLAIGAQDSKKLPQLGENSSLIMDGLQFLSRVSLGDIPELGKEVAVIGGGSAAMDVARTARRLGKDVKLIALETKEIMPAQKDEVAEALEEGIMLFDGVMVDRVALSEDTKMSLACVKVTMDPSVTTGVLKPLPLVGTDFILEADSIIAAIGQDPKLSDLNGLLKTNGPLIETGNNLATSEQGIFAGGDAISQERFVSRAIGLGKKGAAYISSFLGEREEQDDMEPREEVHFDEINLFYFPSAPQIKKAILPVSERLQDFREVKIGVSEVEAFLESKRCFSCGNCIKCDNCYYFCPDMAVKRDPSQGQYHILDQYCKGCGLCVEECPRGVLVLKEESR